jgi:glycosyltransferase involved in cell wall biosynthesis
VRRAFTLVFFARHPRVLPVLAEAVAAGQAQLLVKPPTAVLAALYAGAAAFVFPSWIEGFGIPLLEAMSYGTPIIASDRGAIPEVAGDAALFVDAEDDAALAAALERVLTNPSEADRLRTAGTARVAQFTWRRSAEQTLATLRRAHAALETGRPTR